MRLQSFVRLFAVKLMAVFGLIAAIGLLGLSIDRGARSAQAQAVATATPRSASTPIAAVSITYTVKSGDSFNAIARQFDLTPQQLQALNAITNTSVIRVGQVLIVAVSTLTPTPAPTKTPTPTRTVEPTATPTSLPTATPTVEPTATPLSAPTVTPIRELPPTVQPAATAVPAIEPPASIPVDVILVGAVMLFAVIGIIIGFRTQRG